MKAGACNLRLGTPDTEACFESEACLDFTAHSMLVLGYGVKSCLKTKTAASVYQESPFTSGEDIWFGVNQNS